MHINVRAMLDQASDEYEFVRRLSRTFGYFPALLAFAQISTFLDAVVPGSGKLAKGNEATNQIQKILSCTTEALFKMQWWRLRGKDPVHGGAPPPLFIIHGFTSENKDRQPGFFDLLVGWAAYVTDMRLARVLFVADQSFGEPAMLAVLKDRPDMLEVSQLRDAELPVVRAFLVRSLGEDEAQQVPDVHLRAVGGRFLDVCALIALLKNGATPDVAVRVLVEAAATTVRTLLVGNRPSAQWTRTHLWRAMRLLATKPNDAPVPYDVFLWEVFRGDEVALRSMLLSNLITVVRSTMPTDAHELRSHGVTAVAALRRSLQDAHSWRGLRCSTGPPGCKRRLSS